MSDFTPPNLPNGCTAPFYNDRIIAHEMVHAVMYRGVNIGKIVNANDQTQFPEGAAEFIHGADERLATSIANVGITGVVAAAGNFGSAGGAWGGTSDEYSAAYSAIRYLHQEVKNNDGNGIKDVMVFMNQNPAAKLDDSINATTTFTTADLFNAGFVANGAAFIAGMNLADADTNAVGGSNADGGPVKTAESVVSDAGIKGNTTNPLNGFNEIWEDIVGTHNE